MYELSIGENIFLPQMTSEGPRSRSTPKSSRSSEYISTTIRDREKVSIEVR